MLTKSTLLSYIPLQQSASILPHQGTRPLDSLGGKSLGILRIMYEFDRLASIYNALPDHYLHHACGCSSFFTHMKSDGIPLHVMVAACHPICPMTDDHLWVYK